MCKNKTFFDNIWNEVSSKGDGSGNTITSINMLSNCEQKYDFNSSYNTIHFVDEVEFVSNCYVDIEYKPTNKTIIEINFSIDCTKTNSSEEDITYIFGCGDNKSNYFSLGKHGNNSWILHLGNKIYTLEQNSPISGQYVIGLHEDKICINDTITELESNNMTSVNYGLFINGINNSGIAYINNNGAEIKVFSVKIFENDNIILLLIPVKYGKDEDAGLYDVINNKLYLNYRR